MMPPMMPIMVPMMMRGAETVHFNKTKMDRHQKVVKRISNAKYERTPVPKQDLKQFNNNTGGVSEITTIMLRGIPCSFSQERLMKILDNAGLKGKYDFFYLPRADSRGNDR